MNSKELSIIFEDDTLLVLNKPAGITVNRSDTTKDEKTVQDLVEDHLGKEHFEHINPAETEGDEELSSDYASRSGIVHRIDKETSGILLVAKTEAAFIHLQQQFKTRVVKKTYVALAHGRLTPEEGEINVPVGRLPWNRRQFGVVAGGRESVTHYKVKSYYRTNDKKKDILTFVQLHPLTGRTHQIRVHLQYLGHPIFADFLYAGRKTQREDRKILERVFLHAATISFTHPKTDEEVTFEAPLPPELERVFDFIVPIV